MTSRLIQLFEKLKSSYNHIDFRTAFRKNFSGEWEEFLTLIKFTKEDRYELSLVHDRINSNYTKDFKAIAKVLDLDEFINVWNKIKSQKDVLINENKPIFLDNIKIESYSLINDKEWSSILFNSFSKSHFVKKYNLDKLNFRAREKGFYNVYEMINKVLGVNLIDFPTIFCSIIFPIYIDLRITYKERDLFNKKHRYKFKGKIQLANIFKDSKILVKDYKSFSYTQIKSQQNINLSLNKETEEGQLIGTIQGKNDTPFIGIELTNDFIIPKKVLYKKYLDFNFSQLVPGNYFDTIVVIQNFIGEGKSGEVYESVLNEQIKNLKIGDIVATKIYKSEIMEEPNQKKRILREFRTGTYLDHPNLMKIYFIGEFHYKRECKFFLIMELLKGETLKQYIEKNFPIDLKQIVNIFTQLCNSVEFLHSNRIIHRDIKPDNIMINGEDQLKLMDYGVVKNLLDTRITATNQFLGSIRYSAPEYLFNLAPNKKIDNYSIGAILYYLLYGHEIYNFENNFSNLILLKSESDVRFDLPLKNHSKLCCLMLEITRRFLFKNNHHRLSIKDAFLELEHLYEGDIWKSFIKDLLIYRIETFWCPSEYWELFPKDPLEKLYHYYRILLPKKYFDIIFRNLEDTDWIFLYCNENIDKIISNITEAELIISTQVLNMDYSSWQQKFLNSRSVEDKTFLLRSLACKVLKMGFSEQSKFVEKTLPWVTENCSNPEIEELCLNLDDYYYYYHGGE